MAQPMTADDILPLVTGLDLEERVRLLRLISECPDADDARVYGAAPPKPDEFSSSEELLAWEAEGWEETD